MSTLLIHHLEPMWEHGYRMMHTSFEDMAAKVYYHIKKEKSYDNIIMTFFENTELTDDHWMFNRFTPQVYDYAYGWDLGEEMDYDIEAGNTTEWTEGGNHSRHVWVPDWIHQLARNEDDIGFCGAFDGECIEDMEIALEAAGAKYHRLNHLIV